MKLLQLRITLVTLILLIFCVLLEEEIIIQYGHWMYLIHFIVMTFELFRLKNNFIYLLSPSNLILTYLNISFFFGHYVVVRNIDFYSHYYNAFLNYESVSFITFFFISCNLFVFLSIPFNKFRKLKRIHRKPMVKYRFKLPVLYLLIFLLGFVTIDLSIIGGGTNFTYPIKLGIAILIIFISSDLKVKAKVINYILLFLLFIVSHYESKREIIFVLVLILTFEVIKKFKAFRLELRQVMLAILAGAMFIYLILVASILRGYGGYDVDNPIDATSHVYDYLGSERIGKALAINFEMSTVYGNSSNAVDYVYKGEVDYLLGSTFIKFVFLPIPRKIFPDKPQTMVSIYTKKFLPEYHAKGSTRPITYYAEAYWNFSFFCILFIFIFTRWINNYYVLVVNSILSNQVRAKSVFLIFMYITIIQFIRGAGFELWLLYALVQLPITYFLIKLLFSKNE